jgi:hypothetical protein
MLSVVAMAKTTLSKMAATHATRTLQKVHNCLTRAVHHAEGQDLVRRNVSALVDTPPGREGRPSQSLTLEQAGALLEAAKLPEIAVEALRAQKRRQAEERPQAGDLWQEQNLVFTTSVGTPFESHNLRREFRKVTAAAGLGSRWVPKELRTSFVSMMSYRGVPVEEIARVAGHASSRTTEVIYRRELRPVITTGAEVMDQIFRVRRDQGTTAGAAR